MKRQERHFRMTLFVFLFCMLMAYACTPAKVRVTPREIPPEKTTPSKAAPDRTAPETAPSVKTETGIRPAEKIPEVKPVPEETYAETVSRWRSYQDVVKWMENDFSFDKERYERFRGTLPVPRTPEETFKLKSGIYIDAAMFSKETLNRIDPSYKAKIVILIMRPYGFNHYVCSFSKEDKLFIMDYGTPYKEVTGIHGPYRSLEEYKNFYEKNHPMREIEGITYLP